MAARLALLTRLLVVLCCGAGWYSTCVRAQSFLPEAGTTRDGENACLPTGLEELAGSDLFSSTGTRCRLQPCLAEHPSDLLFAAPEQPLPNPPRDPAAVGGDPVLVGGDPVLPEGSRQGPRFQVPLTGPVFLFAQVNRDEVAAASSARWAGQTGVAWKVPLAGAAEALFCCGPGLSSLEPSQAGRVPEYLPFPLQPHWLQLDARCRWSLVKDVGLEFQATACPAFNPGERDQMSQDLRVVVPVGSSGQLHFGARYSWENSEESKPASEGSQLYGGLRLRW